MRTLTILTALTALAVVPAFADEPVSAEQAESIQAALNLWDCEGGTMEMEPGDPVIYEIDDAECHDGEYDFKLDDEFKVILVSGH
ncbi:hypothetical protein [Bauldia sp.]|uniref:hypothetical protein n=1 Tax=Bauldia sp. TaxID=2575872 RepID=UPI003BAD443C